MSTKDALAKLRRELKELKQLEAARSAGSDAAITRKSDDVNPHPEGSSLYCAWQNGYWGERSHGERVAILRMFAGEEPDRNKEWDVKAMVRKAVATLDWYAGAPSRELVADGGKRARAAMKQG